MNTYDPQTTEEASEFLAESRILFRRSATILAKRINALEEVMDPETKATSTVVKDMRQALDLVIEESKNVEKIDKSFAAASGLDGYDLAAARSEIGSRLARLRAARGDRDVSGQPE
jgi:hypothetical protein